MKLAGLALALVLLLPSGVRADSQPEPRLLVKVTPLPVALSDDFEFRKTKLYFLGEKPPRLRTTRSTSLNQYRLFGAVTALDQRQRFGDYFDFFWRVKRPADVTVRLEYRQEKIHDLVQAQEVSYTTVRGTHKTEFKVIGDDYLDDGRVTAWRCLLIENSRIVAEKRSYMWD